jgi:hypothetical protein
MDDHLASGHGGAPFGWLDLQDQIVKADDISPVHGSFELLGEDQVQVPARAGRGSQVTKPHNIPSLPIPQDTLSFLNFRLKGFGLSDYYLGYCRADGRNSGRCSF